MTAARPTAIAAQASVMAGYGSSAAANPPSGACRARRNPSARFVASLRSSSSQTGVSETDVTDREERGRRDPEALLAEAVASLIGLAERVESRSVTNCRRPPGGVPARGRVPRPFPWLDFRRASRGMRTSLRRSRLRASGRSQPRRQRRSRSRAGCRGGNWAVQCSRKENRVVQELDVLSDVVVNGAVLREDDRVSAVGCADEDRLPLDLDRALDLAELPPFAARVGGAVLCGDRGDENESEEPRQQRQAPEALDRVGLSAGRRGPRDDVQPVGWSARRPPDRQRIEAHRVRSRAGAGATRTHRRERRTHSVVSRCASGHSTTQSAIG